MRLLLGTHSVHGLQVFRNVQEKVELEQLQTRSQLRDEDQNQVSVSLAKLDQENYGIGCSKFQKEAEALIISRLSRAEVLNFFTIATEILESIPMRMPHINKLVNDMKKRRVITFDLPSGKRVPQEGTMISLIQ